MRCIQEEIDYCQFAYYERIDPRTSNPVADTGSNPQTTPASRSGPSPSLVNIGYQEVSSTTKTDDEQTPALVRRLSRKRVPGLPRAPTFKRQQSELRDRLESAIPKSGERRTLSADRGRSGNASHPGSSSAVEHGRRLSGPEYGERIIEKERRPSPIHTREKLVERERSPSPPPFEAFRTRVVERETRAPSPSPSPSPPPSMRAPPIHQETITHYRHADHGKPYS
jgi:hypothetical protein